MDALYELPYERVPHPAYGDARIPAYEMIRFSVAIQRGCFGGCTFCSITEHEGRIIQSPFGRFDYPRDRNDKRSSAWFYRRDFRSRWSDCKYVSSCLQEHRD